MRRLAPAALIVALALVVLVAPASARIDHHFSVLTQRIPGTGHETSDGFKFRERLFQVDNPANQVGNDRAQCHERGDKLRCRAVIHLNGEVGGFGFLRVNGNVGRHDGRLNVLSGTDDFVGVAGKVLVHGRHKLHFDLIR